MRWGSGSLQEIDHLPFVSPLVKSAETVKDPARIAAVTAAALDRAAAAPSGPTFVDYPLDVVFTEAEVDIPGLPEAGAAEPAAGVEEAAALLAAAERPAIMAGTGLYWGRGEEELRALAEALGHPGLPQRARPRLPARRSRARLQPRPRHRSAGRRRRPRRRRADGLPARLRRQLRRGDEDRPPRRRPERAASPTGRPRSTWSATSARPWRRCARRPGSEPRTKPWLEQLRNVESEKRAAEQEELNEARSPLHPVRVYKELGEVLDRDAIVVGDGGDFVSYAGRFIETFEPGCWMDPGPFGCLGAGPGQAIGAKVAHPDRQVCLLLGDGAFGFAGMEFDTMSRHGLGVVGVMGNNGIWGLEHHPMKFLYGYSVAAELQPETRYDELVESLGCDGILVREPGELKPALERAFASGRPTLVNVLTDPEVAYPRKSNLA